MKIHWGNIEDKVNKRLHDKDMEERTDKIVDDIMCSKREPSGKPVKTAEDAAEKFAQVLHIVLDACAVGEGIGDNRPLGPTAVDSLKHLDTTRGVKIGRLKYLSSVYFADDLHRDSLLPEYFDGIENIAALLNNGYGPTKASVYGNWHGHHIEGLRRREGLRFMQEAKLEFEGNYSSEYGVENVDLNEIYE